MRRNISHRHFRPGTVVMPLSPCHCRPDTVVGDMIPKVIVPIKHLTSVYVCFQAAGDFDEASRWSRMPADQGELC